MRPILHPPPCHVQSKENAGCQTVGPCRYGAFAARAFCHGSAGFQPAIGCAPSPWERGLPARDVMCGVSPRAPFALGARASSPRCDVRRLAARAVCPGSAGFQPAKMLARRAATHWRPRASRPFSGNFVRFASFVAKNCRDAIGSNCFLDVSIIQDILKRLDEIPALLVFRNQIPDFFPKSHCFPTDEKNWLHAT